MPESRISDIPQFPPTRPILLWLAEGDESHVIAGLQAAGEFLNVPAEAVAAAIASGEPIQGWFVDWEVESPNS